MGAQIAQNRGVLGANLAQIGANFTGAKSIFALYINTLQRFCLEKAHFTRFSASKFINRKRLSKRMYLFNSQTLTEKVLILRHQIG
jgi:hypothetical protein